MDNLVSLVVQRTMLCPLPQAMELLSEDACDSTIEEAITVMAAEVGSLKGQLQSMSNKYRKLWRGRDTGGCGYNLRSTPTREGSGGTPHWSRSVAKSNLHVERRVHGEEEREGEKVELVETTVPPCRQEAEPVQLFSSAGVSMAEPTAIPLDPAVLQLLERCADRLVVMVEKRLHN